MTKYNSLISFVLIWSAPDPPLRLTAPLPLLQQYETDAAGSLRPVEIRFVDLQMCQLGDLAYDLVYCLICSSNREIRRNHIREMLAW